MKEIIIKILLLLPYIWAFTGLLLYKDGNKAVVVFVLISTVVSLTQYKIKELISYLKKDYFFLSILLLTSFSIIARFHYGYNSNELRALICSFFVMLFIPSKNITRNDIFIFSILGTISTFIYVMYYSVYLDISRAALSINAIPYSVICSVLLIINIIQIKEKQKTKNIAILFLTLINLSCIFILETRGVWIALILPLLLIAVNLTNKNKIKHIITPTLLMLLILFSFHSEIKCRIMDTTNEISQLKIGNDNTSIGLRLQMWELTPLLIKDNYLIGLGENQKYKFKLLYKEGKVSKSLYHFQPNQYHNQYVDNIIKGGIVGSIIFFMFLISPLINNKNKETHYKLLCISFILLYSISGLTESIFIHGQTLLLFTMIIHGYKHISKNREQYE